MRLRQAPLRMTIFLGGTDKLRASAAQGDNSVGIGKWLLLRVSWFAGELMEQVVPGLAVLVPSA